MKYLFLSIIAVSVFSFHSLLLAHSSRATEDAGYEHSHAHSRPHSHSNGAHQHEHASAQDHSHADLDLKSVGEAWGVIQTSMQTIESSINKGNLEPIHEAEEELHTALHYMEENSGMVTGDKAKRLKSALTQAMKLSSNVHEISDTGNIPKTKTEFSKLQRALKLVEAQYAADALKNSGNEHAHHSDHRHHHAEAAEPTISMNVVKSDSLQVGKKTTVVLKLITKKDGKPVTLNDLKEVHTEKVHLLMIDSSLTDYHHIHPQAASQSGEYTFTFTPVKPGPYRVWADLIPVTTETQEYVMTDLPAFTKGETVADRQPKLKTDVHGLNFELTFETLTLTAGKEILAKLKITDKNGKVFNQLEPVMGAYAHLVGFGEDFKSIAHVHPMGSEPKQASDRGVGELEFHIVPTQAGIMRLFAQVRINGADQFAKFTLKIDPASK